MKILYIDESGDHNLLKIDENYPVFVLCGVIFDCKKLDKLNFQIDNFKNIFGNKNRILYTADISRRKNGYEFLNDKKAKDEFYLELNNLMNNLEYDVISCIIDKKKYIEKYQNDKRDVYEYSLDILVERFYYQLGGDFGLIQCEARNEELDNQINIAWQSIANRGTYYISGDNIQKRINRFSIHKKTENINGLQIADLCAGPIGRHYIKKQPKADFKIIQKKLVRNSKGKAEGWGVVVRP
jgi:hypothetical protein